MGLFKKPTPTVEELAKSIASLSDEDKKKLLAQAFGQVEETSESESEETTTEETADSDTETPNATEETSEDSDNGEQTETEADAPVDEQVSEQEEPSESEVQTEEVAEQTEERHEEVIAAFTARLEALEQKVAKFAEIVDEIDGLHNDGPLGVSAQSDFDDSEDDFDDRIMSAYNPKWRRG